MATESTENIRLEIVENVKRIASNHRATTADLFDLDGTVIDGNLLAETVFNYVLHRMPKGSAVRARVDLALSASSKEVDGRASIYDPAFKGLAIRLVEIGLFLGLNAEALRELQTLYLENVAASCFSWPRALALALRLRQPRGLVLCVTGTPQAIADLLCPILGFDAAIGCEYAKEGDVFVDGESDLNPGLHKDRIVLGLEKECGLVFDQAIAVGDSKFDLDMLGRVAYPVAMNPKPDMFEAIRESGRIGKPIAWVDQTIGERVEDARCWLPCKDGRLRFAQPKDFLPTDVCGLMAAAAEEMRRSWRYR